jgi:tRNA threonylcarbamoyladenosine biosynthesis protein TsaB
VNILAIDVTSAHGSLAIRSNGAVAAESHLESPDGFAHIIFDGISELLDKASLTLNEIDCFASASGPGAFTGVRVGLTTVKGLAEALRRPVVGVSNLRALAAYGKTNRRAVVLDARRGDVFGAVYGGDLQPLSEEMVGKLGPWLAGLPPDVAEFIVQDDRLLDGLGLPATLAPAHLAPAIAACAELDRERGLWIDPAALDANYVRRSDAELSWRET